MYKMGDVLNMYMTVDDVNPETIKMIVEKIPDYPCSLSAKNLDIARSVLSMLIPSKCVDFQATTAVLNANMLLRAAIEKIEAEAKHEAEWEKMSEQERLWGQQF